MRTGINCQGDIKILKWVRFSGGGDSEKVGTFWLEPDFFGLPPALLSLINFKIIFLKELI